MKFFDFDEKTQEIFNSFLSNFKLVNWKTWLRLTSREDYEDLTLKLSGLDTIDNLFERIKKEETDSRSFSIELSSFLNSYNFKEPLILCHTSGTTNSEISQLKWFHMTKYLIERVWAPGMQAIFESSGLDSKSSAIIFVPSRLKFDGINKVNGKEYISLYSSEFSQRVMLSVLKPKEYLFYEYKKATDLEIISKILNLSDIAVISAPAITILKWANKKRLREEIKNSFSNTKKDIPFESNSLINLIKREGANSASNKIYSLLSDKLSNSTIIFSISSLNQTDWDLIRKFMKWEKGKEKFTNLYVASEIGPFAASIAEGDYEISRSNQMFVFPLTLPIIEKYGERSLISRSSNKIGKLYVSRFNNGHALINIDIGDVIYIKNQDALPIIDGKILRAGFNLKYPINISKKVTIPSNYNLYAGEFFSFGKFDIVDPRNLLNCLNRNCQNNMDLMLLIGSTDKINEVQPWKLVLQVNENSNCATSNDFLEKISKCPREQGIYNAIKEKYLELELIDEPPVDFIKARSEMLSKVRKGQIPKGILKKWPLYIVSPLS
ncbi:MAG: hypothetical protein ACFFDO_05675 [Candidatus Thorarchaeota archaeon]